MRRYAILLAWLQGASYVVIGGWALATGALPARGFAALLLVVGLVLLVAAARRRVNANVALLAAGVALALSICDVIFVSLHSISAVYLLDAIPEIALVVLWGLAARREKGH